MNDFKSFDNNYDIIKYIYSLYEYIYIPQYILERSVFYSGLVHKNSFILIVSGEREGGVDGR